MTSRLEIPTIATPIGAVNRTGLGPTIATADAPRIAADRGNPTWPPLAYADSMIVIAEPPETIARPIIGATPGDRRASRTSSTQTRIWNAASEPRIGQAQPFGQACESGVPGSVK